MRRDRVVIVVVTVTVVSAILFGFFMAYRTYKLPMGVNDIDDTILLLKGTSKNDNALLLERLTMFKELSRSCKMKEKTTGKVRRFSKEEMEEIYNAIGGKEAVIQYLNSIENEEEKKEKSNYALDKLEIITVDEWNKILNKIDI